MVSRISRLLGIGVAAAVLISSTAAPALAQATDPNPGAITLMSGVDFPSTYFFRGIRQESDPAFTTFAFGDVGIALSSGDGGLKSSSINFGVWNSLHTGTSGSGSDIDGKGIHYEEDFYVMLNLGFGGGVTVTPFFTAYTSANGSFGTVQELAFKVAHASKFAPYGIIAFELKGQADGGSEKGTYMELGVGPSFPLGGGVATVAIPVKMGLSLSDYYEFDGSDNAFGYFDAGVLFTVPLSGVASQFGSWNIHGGVNFLGFGDGTKGFNNDDSSQVIGSFGIGMSY